MRISEIRRYPVKSMGGESLQSIDVDARGLAGDRWFAVVDATGKLGSGKNSRRFRRFDEIFEYHATVVDGDTRVAGPTGSWLVGDPELDRVLGEQTAADVRVLSEAGTPHQDAGQVSLVGTASLDWCREHLDVDGDRRRIRPNLVVSTTEPFVEEGWGGATIRVGTVELTVVERIERCRMVDIAQEGLAEQSGWLKALGRERDLCLGIYADVAGAGIVAVGDRVDVVPMKHSPRD
jgi:MOSC domain-containing protein